MTTELALAVTSLDDFSRWARSDGLEIIMLVSGSVLLTRFASWFGAKATSRIDAQDRDRDTLVRSEAAKHRHSVAQVVTWAALVLIYCVTGILVLERLKVPITSLVAPATIAGVALGFGAQRVVQDVLAGFFIITERQYGFGDLIRISNIGSTIGVTGTVEDVTLRVTNIRTVDGEVVIIPMVSSTRSRTSHAAGPAPSSTFPSRRRPTSNTSTTSCRPSAPTSTRTPSSDQSCSTHRQSWAWTVSRSTASVSVSLRGHSPASSSSSAVRWVPASPPHCRPRASPCLPKSKPEAYLSPSGTRVRSSFHARSVARVRSHCHRLRAGVPGTNSCFGRSDRNHTGDVNQDNNHYRGGDDIDHTREDSTEDIQIPLAHINNGTRNVLHRVDSAFQREHADIDTPSPTTATTTTSSSPPGSTSTPP